MVVYKHSFLVYLKDAVVYLSDADAANVFIVVNRADQYLCAGVRVALGSGDIV